MKDIKKLLSLNLKKFFDVDQEQVFNRLLRSLLPNPFKNFIYEHLVPLPDLYGPFWIGITLIFSTAICGNLVHYIEFEGLDQYQTDFTLVTGAMSLVFSYILFVPFILYWTFWYRRLETQYSYLELLCLYGYSLTAFIPVSMLWVINFYWFRWALIGVAVAVGWFILFNVVWTALKSDSNAFASLIIIAGVLLLHACLGLAFKTYYFDSVLPSHRGFPAATAPQLVNLQASKGPAQDIPSHPDTSETVYISSLALLKMLRHARSGVPMEVMGLMLGEFVDDYTINVVDVFAMPQSGTGVSVEDVDPVYEAKMLDVLKATNRSEMVVGWYHSHPGFGCWLSSVDVATQQSFEALAAIQSARGKVVIDAFRSIPNMGFGDAGKLAPTSEPRQTTSNLGHLVRPSVVAQVHGLGFRYYSLPITCRLGSKESNMLQKLNTRNWVELLHLETFTSHAKHNEDDVGKILKLTRLYKKSLEEEEKMTKKQKDIKNVGKQDPKRHLTDTVNEMLGDNIVQNGTAMIDTASFR